MKGLIPAAGKGTRMRPFTLAYPKELLPVGTKAVIEHVIETMKKAGIEEIVVVVGWKQHAILDYLGSGERLDVDITYVVQDDRNGLAGAVKTGEDAVDGESFAVILGDNYLTDCDALKELKEFHNSNGWEATIGSFKVDDPTSYGIIDGEDGHVNGLVEKPSREEAPSDEGIAGIYVFEPSIFDAIEKIGRGKGNEYQLTDAIDLLRKETDKIGYMRIPGDHIDVGTPERLRKANREYDLRD